MKRGRGSDQAKNCFNIKGSFCTRNERKYTFKNLVNTLLASAPETTHDSSSRSQHFYMPFCGYCSKLPTQNESHDKTAGRSSLRFQIRPAIRWKGQARNIWIGKGKIKDMQIECVLSQACTVELVKMFSFSSSVTAILTTASPFSQVNLALNSLQKNFLYRWADQNKL